MAILGPLLLLLSVFVVADSFDPCSLKPCHDRAYCSTKGEGRNKFKCTCREGYLGDGFACNMHKSDVCSYKGTACRNKKVVCLRTGESRGRCVYWPVPRPTDSYESNREAVYSKEGAFDHDDFDFLLAARHPCTLNPCHEHATCRMHWWFKDQFYCTCNGFHSIGDGFSCEEDNSNVCLYEDSACKHIAHTVSCKRTGMNSGRCSDLKKYAQETLEKSQKSLHKENSTILNLLMVAVTFLGFIVLAMIVYKVYSKRNYRLAMIKKFKIGQYYFPVDQEDSGKT